MTLFKACTNHLCAHSASQYSTKLFTAGLAMILITGCSSQLSTPLPSQDQRSNQSSTNAEKTSAGHNEDLDHLNQSIVDMVNVQSPANTTPQSKDTATKTAGMDLNQIHRHDYAIQAEQMLALAEPAMIAKYQLALSQMKNKQWSAAEASFDEVISRQPNFSGAIINKALIVLQNSPEQHQPNSDALRQANELLAQAIEVNPSNPYAHQIQGKVARLMGHLQQAEQSYREALSIWPSYPEAQLNLAILLELYQGKLVEARDYYLAYLEQQPDDEQARRWLAAVELKINRAGLTIPVATDAGSLTTAEDD